MSFFKGQNTRTESEKIKSFQACVCEFGSAVPLLYGSCKTSPNLINYQDFTSTKHSETVKSGKARQTTVTYYYDCYLELALGEKIKAVQAVWVGDTKYDSIAALNAAGNRTEGAPLAVNIGNNSNPTTYMSEKHSDIAVGYGSLAYAYGYVYLGEDSASVPSYSFQVLGNLTEAQYKADGIDANPAYIIKDLLQRIGLGDYIDSTSFDNYADYCQKADLLVSTPSGKFDSQVKAQEICKELLDLTNTYMFWNTDRFVFIPRDDREQDGWLPNTTVCYDIDAQSLADNGGGVVGFQRKDSSQIYNAITVKFTNRSNEFEQESVSYQDVDDIREKGIKSVTLDGLWFHTKERAIRYAKAYARRCLTEINQYTLKLPWNYARLMPGDLIRVTDEKLGLDGQIMMVSEVQEDKHGLITVTALQRAAGNYSEASYTVANDYNIQDFNVDPGSVDSPIFIIPPADLVTSANGLEVWIGLRGKTAGWGGCNVYVSDKDGDYKYLGVNNGSSAYGTIKTAMTSTSSEVVVEFGNVETVALPTGSQYDAENGNTLIWINGECMSYTSASLVTGNSNKYTLSGLVRGQYGTTAAAHTIGDSMALINGSIYVVPLTKHYLNRQLYFKFPSFNMFKANEQSLTAVDNNNQLIVKPYSCIAAASDLPNCSGLTAINKYRELADDVTRYDVIVEWQPPDFASYKQAQVWYKTSGAQVGALGVIPSGVTAAEAGYTSSWIYAGQGYNTVTIPQAVVGDKYLIAVCTEDIYGNTESPDMSSQLEHMVARKSEIPNTPDGFAVAFSQVITASWKTVRNADVKQYIINSANSYSGSVLARTTSTEAILDLSERSGTLYLWALSAYGAYSAPAVMTYSKRQPLAPGKPICTARLEGIAISMDLIPADCIKIRLYINDTVIDCNTNSYYYSCSAGVYNIKYCFVDVFGNGEMSGQTVLEVEAYIDPALINLDEENYAKLSAATKESISAASIDKINLAVAGLLGAGSALVMDGGSYALVAGNGEKLTGVFANEGGVLRLQGDYVHITGDSVFDENVIIKGNMRAGSVSCDAGVVINAGAVAITNNGIVCTEDSGASVTFNSTGMTFQDKAGHTYAGLQRCVIGQANHGQTVTFDNAWDRVPTVICMPQKIQTQYGENYSSANVKIVCDAINITKNGFKVRCYSTLADASGSNSGMALGNYSGTQETYTDRWGSYTLGTYTLPAVANNSSVDIGIDIDAYIPYGFIPDTAESGLEGYYLVNGKTYCEIYLYKNNSQVAKYATDTITDYVAFLLDNDSSAAEKAEARAKKRLRYNYNINLTPSDVVKVKIIYYYRKNYGESTRSVGCSAKLSVFNYNITNPVTIGTGTATFFAVENINGFYTVS